MEAGGSILNRLNWEVLWIVHGRKKGRKGTTHVIKKDFEDDFAGALAFYGKVLIAGKKGATLRCQNMGFPPPPDKRPRYISKRVRNPRGRIEIRQGWIYPMNKLNQEGIFWCCYCIKFRRFERKTGFRADGIYVREEGFHCPVCGISHRNHHIRKWNPLIPRIAEDYMGPKRVRRSTSTRRRRTR